MKYNEDIRAEITAERDALNVRLNALAEYEHYGAKYRPGELTMLKGIVSSDPEWTGTARPEPELEIEESPRRQPATPAP